MRVRGVLEMGLVAAAMVSMPLAVNAAEPTPGPVYRPPPISLIYNWSGFYVGGHLGAGWADGGSGGALGGGQVGFNYQINPQWVLGIEGDFAGTTIKDSVNASFVFPSAPGFPPMVATTGASASLDWVSTLAARFGYVFDRWLVYGKAGGAWAHATANISSSVIIPGVGGIGGGGTIDQTVSGWVLGVGTEYALWNNLSAKVEYDLIDFGNNNPFADNAFHVFKAGINYRFGSPGGLY
jgi:outer membrane immunogenic protein